MKKLLIGFLAGIVVTSVPLTLAYSGIFSDVKEGVWYTEAIETLAELEIIAGYNDGTFQPENDINRAETAVILNRVLKFVEYNYDQYPVVDAKGPFESNYVVCESAETGLRIYQSYWCGDDSCGTEFYNHEGDLIESVPHGDGTGDPEPSTQATNCQHTTEEYFKSKVQED